MEGLLAGPPSSFLDYLFSLHCLPVTGSLAASALLHFYGYGSGWGLIIMCGGVIASAVLFTLLPLPIITPIGGNFNVGVVHVDGHYSKKIPPLAVFYPTRDPPSRRGIQYVPFGDLRFFDGLSNYAKVPFFIFKDEMFVRLRVTANAVPIPLLLNDVAAHPIIIFSHGLAGYHRLYSCFLSDMAARGAIILAIGHGDGSASFMRDDSGKESEVIFKNIGWEVPLREAQLKQRIAETRQIIQLIKRPEFWRRIGFSEDDAEKFTLQLNNNNNNNKDKNNNNNNNNINVHLSGHSFGGATVMAAALEEENDLINGGRVGSVTAFDPWALPIKNEYFLASIKSGKKKYTTPTLTRHSEQWFRDGESWDFFKKTAEVIMAQPELDLMNETQKRGIFLTETGGGAHHLSVTDIGILSPIFHGTPTNIIPPRAQIVDLVNANLHFVKRFL